MHGETFKSDTYGTLMYVLTQIYAFSQKVLYRHDPERFDANGLTVGGARTLLNVPQLVIFRRLFFSIVSYNTLGYVECVLMLRWPKISKINTVA